MNWEALGDIAELLGAVAVVFRGKSGPIPDVSDWRYRILGITDSTHTEVRVEQAAADHRDYDVVKEDCACVSRREVVVNKNVLDVHISSA